MPRAAMSPSPSIGRAWAAFSLGCAVAVVVAACGPAHADADPSATAAGPAATGTPAVPSPTPSPTSIYAAPPEAYLKPERPAILDGKPSEDAAIAFAKYYLRLYTYAYLTGDADDLNALGRTGCVYCNDVASDLAREYGAGGHDEGGAITVKRATAHDFTVEGAFKVVLYGEQAPSRELDDQGDVVVDYPRSTPFEYDFALVWKADLGWAVAQMAAVGQ